MTTVESYTKVKVDELIGTTIVDAEVVGDNLILTKGDGSTINVGSIEGPPGPAGAGGVPTVVPSCRVDQIADQVITQLTFTPITFDAEIYDTDSMHDPGVNPTRVTAQTAGVYSVDAGVLWQFNANGGRVIQIKKNGVESVARQDQDSAATLTRAANVGTTVKLDVGDYLELVVYQDSGGNLSIDSGSTDPNAYMALTYLGGTFEAVDANEELFYAVAVTLLRPSKYKIKFGNFGAFSPTERIYAKSINLVKMGASAVNYAGVYNNNVDSVTGGAVPVSSGDVLTALGTSSFLSYVTETAVAAVANPKKTFNRMMAQIMRTLDWDHYQATQLGTGSGGSEKTGATSGDIDTGTYGALVLHAESQGYQAGIITDIGGNLFAGWGPPAAAITADGTNDNWMHTWSGWHQVLLPMHTLMDGNAMTWKLRAFTAHATYDAFTNARIAKLPADWDTDE